MLLINGKAMLRIGDRYVSPGDEMEVPENLGKKLKQAGLATETASVKPKENAMMPKAEPKAKPKHLGGGWFEVRGQKVQGKEAAEKLLKEGD